MNPFAIDGVTIHLLRDGTSSVAAHRPGPPARVDGFNVGSVRCEPGPGPHRGELHPDGDELLYVVTGRIAVVLDDGDASRAGAERRVELGPGEAFLVPKGTWHLVETLEAAQLVHVTPGPRGAYRPR